MITSPAIQEVRDFALSQIERYQAPSLFHLNYANEKGQWLAEKLGADRNIILMGTLLMDCRLGKAISEGRILEHVSLSAKAAETLLRGLTGLTADESENIVQCVLQHHGAKKFYSVEAEICCNADCYRFASVKGAMGGMISGRKMEMDELFDLYSQKAKEKWGLVTLDICKNELAPQYRLLRRLFGDFLLD